MAMNDHYERNQILEKMEKLQRQKRLYQWQQAQFGEKKPDLQTLKYENKNFLEKIKSNIRNAKDYKKPGMKPDKVQEKMKKMKEI